MVVDEVLFVPSRQLPGVPEEEESGWAAVRIVPKWVLL